MKSARAARSTSFSESEKKVSAAPSSAAATSRSMPTAGGLATAKPLQAAAETTHPITIQIETPPTKHVKSGRKAVVIKPKKSCNPPPPQSTKIVNSVLIRSHTFYFQLTLFTHACNHIHFVVAVLLDLYQFHLVGWFVFYLFLVLCSTSLLGLTFNSNHNVIFLH